MECNYYKRPKDCDDGLTFILIPSSLGDDSPRSTVAPSNGRYQDTIVKYEANDHTYLYAHDGTYDMIWRSSTVTTVNGKTGDVRLNAEDVGALPSDTFIPTSTSELVNDSGFITDGDIPSKTSQLVNDSGFITRSDVPTKVSQLTNDAGYITASAADRLVNNEKTARQTADAALQTSISNEVANRQTAVSNEVSARQSADNNLHQEIVTEANTRSTNDSRIDAALQEEAETRGIEDATILAEIENEADAREAADQAINAILDNSNYMQDLTMSADANSVSFVEHKKNIGTGATSTETDTIPIASASSAGILTSASYQSIQDSQDRLDALANGAVAIDGLSANPTQAQLTAAWKTATGITDLINRASIWDNTNQKTWTYFTNTETWIVTGTATSQVVINQATNNSLGIVKGDASTSGKIFVEQDGSLSVNGWDATQSAISNKASQSDLTTLSGTVATNTSDITSLQQTVATKADASAIPTTTSELNNDSDFVSDANYVHTDNNYTTAEKNKLGAMPAITAVVDNLTSTSATNPLSANQGKVLNDKFGDYYTSTQTDSAISTAVSGKATTAQAVGTTESYTIASSSWSALSSSDPYTYSATVTATTTIGVNTIVHLLNDQPVDFANYGFAVASVSGQTVTIYSIGQPDSSVTLSINYKEGA